MKSILVTKNGSLRETDEAKRGKIEIVDIPEPSAQGEEVKIKVAYCAICGSDPHLVENIFGWDLPYGMGHELSGVIVEVGEKAVRKGLKVGDRVAGNFLRFCGTCYYCQNGQQQFCLHADESNKPGYSEYVTWHESQVYKLPDDVSLRMGCLLEPVAIAVRIIDKLNPKIGQRVAVCGGGPIGLLVTQAIHMMGAASVTVIEPLAARRELAKEYGAAHIVDPMAEDVRATAERITGGMGFDAVIDCSGAVSAAAALPDITARGGTLMYVAMYPNDYEMPLNLYKAFFSKEITITGTYVAPYAFPRALQIMPRMKLDALCGAVFALGDIEAAFAAQVAGKYPKILVKCNDIPGT